MPPFYRLLETILYSLLNFMPFIVIALYPFRKKLRYSKKVTVLLIVAVTLVQIGLGIHASFFAGENKNALSLASTLIYAIFYFWSVKGNIGKILFTLIMISNIANFIVVSSKCLEGFIFPELARQSYRWSFSVMLFSMELIILVPLFFYIKNKYTSAIEQEADNFQWRYLWLIPATFYLTWFYSTYYNSMSGLEIALKPSNTFFLLLINLGAFLVYCIVVRMVNEHALNLELHKNNHQLTMQSLQYENLRERINEARRAKHDLRHHLTLISGYIDNGDYQGLSDYIHSFMKTIPEDSAIIFCEHYALNMLILYYSQLSKSDNIDFAVDINVPCCITVSDSDISVLVGNLLENALDACSSQKKRERQIVVCGRIENNCLLFTIDNTFENNIRKNPDGVYFSSKHSGTGIGIESARAIVERYKGILRTEQKNGVFYTSVLLNL